MLTKYEECISLWLSPIISAICLLKKVMSRVFQFHFLAVNKGLFPPIQFSVLFNVRVYALLDPMYKYFKPVPPTQHKGARPAFSPQTVNRYKAI